MCWSFNLDMTAAEITADQISPTSSIHLELQHLCTGCFVINGIPQALWLLLWLVYQTLSFNLFFSLSLFVSASERRTHMNVHPFSWWVRVFGASPHWWVEPETLAASLWLSRSCWLRDGWVDCNDPFLATSSWDAPLSQHCCYLVTQFCSAITFLCTGIVYTSKMTISRQKCYILDLILGV